jgi:hypothetical protein
MSIHRKSALRPRKQPSSSALLYLIRKNMWKTKSRPAAGGAPTGVRLGRRIREPGQQQRIPARSARAPRLPKKRKLVNSRQTSYFWKISRALKYILKGVITCAPAGLVELHAECPGQAVPLQKEPTLPGHRQTGPGGAHLERASCCGQEAQRDVGARDQRQLQRSASQLARPVNVFA